MGTIPFILEELSRKHSKWPKDYMRSHNFDMGGTAHGSGSPLVTAESFGKKTTRTI